MKNVTRLFTLIALAAGLAAGTAFAVDPMGPHHSNAFAGPKANTGKVSHVVEDGRGILRVSADFKVPDTPAPTWRVVDSNGAVYTLDAFKIKGGEKRQVTLPAYVKDVARVQVWCAWAEVLLGEAAFAAPVR